jgi:hypothetical protein
MSNRTMLPTPVPRGVAAFPAFLYGILISGVGFGIYILGVMIGFFRIFLDPHGHWIQIVDRIIWYSGMPIIAGILLILFDLTVLLRKKAEPKNNLLGPSVEHGSYSGAYRLQR